MNRLLLLIGFALTSCAPVYVSNLRNTPMFSEAKEFAAAAAIESAGVDVQVAYAVTHNVAIMANGNLLDREGTEQDDYHLRHKHLFGEAGLGYFTKRNNFRFEIFGGYGVAKFKSYQISIFNDPNIVNAKYNRVFFQPSITLVNKDIQLILTTRLSFVNLKDYHIQDVNGNPVPPPQFISAGFFEPALTIRGQITGKLYGYSQFGANIPMNDGYHYDINPFQVALGLQFRIVPKAKADLQNDN